MTGKVMLATEAESAGQRKGIYLARILSADRGFDPTVRFMRVTGGRARGVPIKVDKGNRVRPATDRMREAIFSSLGSRVVDARFLDLFAGTGAYGLEALSRGAISAYFVERDRRALSLIEHNLAAVAKSIGDPVPAARIVAADAFTWRPLDRFDLIIADPPYELIPSRVPAIFALAEKALDTHAEARLCIEHPGERVPSAIGWECIRTLGGGSGQPAMSIFAWVAPET